MSERYVENGKLTQEGEKLAGKMVILQCDRRPCFMCSKQNGDTKGPGGPDCPATDLSSGTKVDEILTIYLGKPPGLESLDSLLK